MGLLIGYAGSVRSEAEVDLVVAAVRAYAKRESLRVIDLTPEISERLGKMREILDSRKDNSIREMVKDALDRVADLESRPPPKVPRVKGVFVKVNSSSDYFTAAFVEREFGWLVDGSVREAESERSEEYDDVLKLLNLMKAKGVKLIIHEQAQYFEPWELEGNEYHSDAAARGENPYYPGLPAPPPGGYRYPNPTGVWSSEARGWLRLHPAEGPPVKAEEVEALYLAGAVSVDFIFARGKKGLEVTPPRDAESRRRLIAALRAQFELEHWEPKDFEGLDELEGDEYDRVWKAAVARLDEERAQDTSLMGPWTIF